MKVNIIRIYITSTNSNIFFLNFKVALSWGLSKGASVIVKSFNEDRLKENMGALDLKLDEYDLLEIEKMEEEKIMKGEFLVNSTTSPYKTIQHLWDDEI